MVHKDKTKLDTLFHLKIVVVTMTLFFVGLVVFETVSYQVYLRGIEDFKNSNDIIALRINIDELAAMSEEGRDAGLCQFNIDSTFSANAATNAVESKEIVDSINRLATANQGSAPTYWTLIAATVTQKSALNGNRSIESSLAQIRNLSQPNTHAQYCRTVAEVFGSAAYLNDLSRPEGVAALFVGQRENFLVNIENSVAAFKSIDKVPSSLAEEHGQLDRLFTSFSELLRGDRNNISEFSRLIANNLQQVESVFDSIKDKTQDIQSLPADMLLLSSTL